MIDVTLLGTGGMMPLPDRALSALYLRCDGKSLLIDCGEGTQTQIRRSGLRFKPIEAILVTHFHADHISGLPGLLLTMGNEGRTEPLTIYGPAGLEEIVGALRCIVPQLPFSIELVPLASDGCSDFFCAGLQATAFPLEHGIPCIGYRLCLTRPGKFDPAAARAKQIPVQLWGRLQRGETVDGFSPADVMGAPRKGIDIVYATDTRPTALLRQYAQGAELLILEGMYGEADKQERAVLTGHSMMQESAQLAADAGAGALWLTHLSPATMEPEQYADALRAIFPQTVIGADGMTTTLRFSD